MADHVLITGGAHRLGQLLVRSFAQAGWHVWCHYARSGDAAHALQQELRGAGWAVDTVAADLAQEPQVLAMMAHIAQRSGGLRLRCGGADAEAHGFDAGTGARAASSRSGAAT
jgi:NAD(P)-dependent dehydrogenase (short-subunit alcohol dehydrogenase family)